MAVRVALAGSTGKIGPTILRVLLEAGFEVIVLTRKGSSSTDSLPKHEKQEIVAVDYTDVKDLTAALRGVEVVVSALSSSGLDAQQPLIDACVAAGVNRFLPSEFSLDLHNPEIRRLPTYPGKKATQRYIDEVAAANPKFTFTYVYTGVWLDWGIKAGFILDSKAHKAILWDGGNVKFSTTRLATVGRAIVAIINNQDRTKNRAVYVHDTAMTMNELIAIIQGLDGIKWTTDEKSTADEEESAYGELSRSESARSRAHLSFLCTVAFGKHYNPDFTERLDNGLLEIPELEGSELVHVVREILTTP